MRTCDQLRGGRILVHGDDVEHDCTAQACCLRP
jgi:hypothetical protein